MQHRIAKNTEFCPNESQLHEFFFYKVSIIILLIRWDSHEFSLITDTQTLTQKC